jgi:hypothetical protein
MNINKLKIMNQKTNLIRTAVISMMTLIASFTSSFQGRCQSYSQGQGFPSAITVESASCFLCYGSNWVDLNYVASPDNLYAETLLNQNQYCFQGTCYYARALEIGNFGFNIPSQSTVVGIKAEVLRKASFPQSAIDTIVQMMSGSSPVGYNKASLNYWSITPGYEVYGDSSDMWGASWTPSMINSADFGIFYKPKNANTNISGVTASVDHVRITVYYADPTGVVESQASDNMFNVFYNHEEQQINLRTSRVKTTNAEVRLFNSMGQLMTTKFLQGNSSDVSLGKINTDNLNEGIYFVELTSGEMLLSKKILISK